MRYSQPTFSAEKAQNAHKKCKKMPYKYGNIIFFSYLCSGK